MKPAHNYLKIVEWSKTDNCFIGSVPGFLGPCCHGDNEQDVYNKLCTILDEWIEIHEKDGLPLPKATAAKNYSGKFILRINSDLHKILAIKAMQSNLSLNQLCEDLLRISVLKKKTA